MVCLVKTCKTQAKQISFGGVSPQTQKYFWRNRRPFFESLLFWVPVWHFSKKSSVGISVDGNYVVGRSVFEEVGWAKPVVGNAAVGNTLMRGFIFGKSLVGRPLVMVQSQMLHSLLMELSCWEAILLETLLMENFSWDAFGWEAC